MNKQQDIVFEIDVNRGTLTFHRSGPWEDYFGYSTGVEYDYATAVNAFVESFVNRDDQTLFMHLMDLPSIRDSFQRQAPLLSADVRIRRPDNPSYMWYRVTIIAPIDGKSNGTIQNIQREKEAVQKLRRQAERDSLTNLFNRHAFDVAVSGQLDGKVANAAFLILDIDDFKSINDTKGHQSGDAVITQVANRLRDLSPDNTLIARFGGDEFVLFVPASTGTDAAAFRQAIRALSVAITMPETDMGCTVSLGVSFFPTDGTTESELLQCADRALYHVKQSGKDDFAFFDASMPVSFAHSNQLKSRRILNVSIKRLIPLAATLLAIIAAIAVLANAYMSSLEDMIRAESLDYLHEIAEQIDTSTVKTLDAYSSQMEIVGAALIDLTPHLDMARLTELLQEKSAVIGCEAIAAVDDDGVWHTTQRRSKIPELNPHLARCLTGQTIYMSEAVSYRGTDYTLIFVPTDFTTSDSIHVCAVVAFIPFDVLSKVLSLTAFDGAGHADVLTTDGRVVIRSLHENCLLTGYNLFATLDDVRFTGVTGLKDVIAGFSAGETGSFRINANGMEQIYYFCKLGYQDWMLLTSVPAYVLESRSQAFMRVTLYACLGIALTFCALMAALAFVQARNKARLEKLAYVDSITGSATREKFQMDAKRLLGKKDGAYTMVYTNVDRFKAVNDRMGTDGANALLRHVAEVLQNAIHNDETVGRIDADHFGVLLATQDTDEIIRRIRKWTRQIVNYPPARQAALTVSMSYGVYIIDDPTLSIDLLLDRSNLGRSAQNAADDSSPRICFYDDKLRERLLFEQLISDTMESALEESRFLLYLQPQFAAATGQLTGYEALARWQSKNYGLLLPGRFIPVFERNGFIVKLDLYMFEQVCRLQRQLMDSGRPVPHISFNVSRVHLNSDNLLSPYLAIWERYRVPAECLTFEFTESVISDNPERLWRVVEAIHQNGFRCSMDDFGAGYSSLNVLHKTNVDEVKIDRSFLGSGQAPSARSKAIIRAVVSLAKELGMQTVAEGVEYAEQADFLREIGCDVIQGYYFAKPLPADEALPSKTADTDVTAGPAG